MAQNVMTGNLGERIRQARIAAGYTTEGLARVLDVSTRTVAGWQADRSKPSYERLARLAGVLEKPVSYFLDEAAA